MPSKKLVSRRRASSKAIFSSSSLGDGCFVTKYPSVHNEGQRAHKGDEAMNHTFERVALTLEYTEPSIFFSVLYQVRLCEDTSNRD